MRYFLKKARRLAMKERARTLKIHLKRCSPLLKYICSDLPLSPLFRSLQFIISSVLPQSWLVSPCVPINTHCIHIWAGTLTVCTHIVEPRVRDSSTELQHSKLHSFPLQRQVECVRTNIFLPAILSYRMIVREGNLFFFARVCPLWPVALPSVTLRWLHLPLAGLPRVWFWKRVEPAERPDL